MRAMVAEHVADIAGRPLAMRDRPVPEPGPEEVRIRVRVCAVCRTDLHVVEGDLPRATHPIIPGHQVVGVVDRVGPEVSTLREGDRAGLAWLFQTCRRCEFCASGRENLCLQARFTGYHVDGGYAEYVVAREAFAYPIPAVFKDEEAAPLLCAGIIGFRALRLSEVHAGQRLGLYGFGASAHIVTQVARHWGCSLYVFSRMEAHRALARDLGAEWVGSPGDTPPLPLHSAIIFAPSGDLVPPALRALNRGGTLALAGIHMSPIPQLDYDHEVFGERTIRSVTANTKQDGLDFLRQAAAIPLRPRTHRYRLEEANEALQALKAGRITGAAVLCIGE